MPRIFLTRTLPLALTLVSLTFCLAQFYPVLAESEVKRYSQVDVRDVVSNQVLLDQDRQNTKLSEMDRRLSDKAAANSERIAESAVKIAEIRAQLDSLSNRVWALLVGVLTQLVNAVWSFVRDKKPPTVIYRPSRPYSVKEEEEDMDANCH